MFDILNPHLHLLRKIRPTVPLVRELSAVSEGKGDQSVATPIMTESGIVEISLD